MRYFETSGFGIKLNWRLRIRHHHKGARGDSTSFTYPDVQGPSRYTTSYSKTESRYGDGYDQLPYETNWVVFLDSYDMRIRLAGTEVKMWGSVQSDRATCYKTVSCKFADFKPT